MFSTERTSHILLSFVLKFLLHKYFNIDIRETTSVMSLQVALISKVCFSCAFLCHHQALLWNLKLKNWLSTCYLSLKKSPLETSCEKKACDPGNTARWHVYTWSCQSLRLWNISSTHFLVAYFRLCGDKIPQPILMSLQNVMVFTCFDF